MGPPSLSGSHMFCFLQRLKIALANVSMNTKPPDSTDQYLRWSKQIPYKKVKDEGVSQAKVSSFCILIASKLANEIN